jgi:Leucine-rich repeat (LRR) protein
MEPEPFCNENQDLLTLNLSANNLQGESPVLKDGGFVDVNFKVFDVSHNGIEGAMPSVTSDSRGMEVFSMSLNKLMGNIAGGGGLIAFNVRIVQLSGNQLVGYFPDLCLIFPKLEVLEVSDNLFDVGVPPKLYKCKNLTHYLGARNLYEGNIPSELGLVSNLKEFDVSGNTLMEGVIPTELGMLSNLEFLGMAETGLVGQIPTPLCSGNDTHKPLQVSADCSKIKCCSELPYAIP